MQRANSPQSLNAFSSSWGFCAADGECAALPRIRTLVVSCCFRQPKASPVMKGQKSLELMYGQVEYIDTLPRTRPVVMAVN